MTDPITIARDDGSPLTLSRDEIVRAMAAMRADDEDPDGAWRKPLAGCRCDRCERLRARAVRRG